jgi:hypothetical protein
MVWAALTIIVMQGVLAIIGLAWIRSFGAYTTDLRAFASALIRTHDANVRVHEHNEYLVEEVNKASNRIRRASELLHDRSLGLPCCPPPNQEKSA